MHANVYSSFILNPQKLETTQMYNWWMDKQIVEHSHNGIVSYDIQEQTTDALNITDRSQEDYVK